MSITNIETLIDKIKVLKDFNDTDEILKNYTGNDWEQYVKINKNRYNRNKVFSNNDFEILIITWDKNQKSEIHDHAHNGCYVKILSGELTEYLFSPNLSLKKETVLTNGNISFMHNNIGYHLIENKGTDASASIHIYSPPNHATKYYKI